ncbi:hypothetical protein EVAR_32610_1 [Eumeta japonica]|uniref:Uncharacterized protein n=1 Tax=Eumeta variegata TaxID=151549 RepID=A0A4C1WJS9_EUMVA|nr:hypothetical protein EVAR_32610_1 [Eumeta japonica]
MNSGGPFHNLYNPTALVPPMRLQRNPMRKSGRPTGRALASEPRRKETAIYIDIHPPSVGAAMTSSSGSNSRLPLENATKRIVESRPFNDVRTRQKGPVYFRKQTAPSGEA